MRKMDWKSCFKIGVTALTVFLCAYYWQAGTNFVFAVLASLSTLLIGGVIAYIVNILMSFLERHYFKNSKKKLINKSRRPVCMVAAFLLVFLIVSLVIAQVVPEIVESVGILIHKVPHALEELSKNETIVQYLPQVSEKLGEADWEDAAKQIENFIKSNMGGAVDIVTSTVSTVFSTVVTFFISLVFSIYLLLGKDKLKAQGNELMTHYLSPGMNEKLRYVLPILNRNFHNFIVGQCTEALILGTLCALGMLLFRFPYAVMIGILVGFTALIPVVGAYVGAAAGIFMMLTVSPTKALLFVVFIVVLQQLEGNLIYPKVVGDSIGLPALWVLASVSVGGGIGGIIGMLVAVPLAATAYQLIQNDVRKRRTAANAASGAKPAHREKQSEK